AAPVGPGAWPVRAGPRPAIIVASPACQRIAAWRRCPPACKPATVGGGRLDRLRPIMSPAMGLRDAPPAMRFGQARWMVAALGVVFGDIGTSPLYTLKTVLDLSGGSREPAVVLGILSLIIWTLIVVHTSKYVRFASRVVKD